jgi:hypothetical protein
MSAAAVVAVGERIGSNDQVRDRLACAGRLAASANVRARRPFERFAPLRQLAGDEQLQTELARIAQELHGAWTAIRSDEELRDEWTRMARQFRRRPGNERKRRQWLRNDTLIAIAVGAGAAFIVSRSSRRRKQTPYSYTRQTHDPIHTEERTQEKATVEP